MRNSRDVCDTQQSNEGRLLPSDRGKGTFPCCLLLLLFVLSSRSFNFNFPQEIEATTADTTVKGGLTSQFDDNGGCIRQGGGDLLLDCNLEGEDEDEDKGKKDEEDGGKYFFSFR